MAAVIARMARSYAGDGVRAARRARARSHSLRASPYHSTVLANAVQASQSSGAATRAAGPSTCSR